MRIRAVLVVCLLFLSGSVARAEFYRWVDKEGREFFTNDREQVPNEYRSGAAAVNPDANRVSIGEKTSVSARPSAPLSDHKDKYGRGEAHWRKRAAKLRKELAVLRDKYDLILKQEKDEENKPKPAKGGKNKKSFDRREKNKTTLERNIVRKKHELEIELPEEARKVDAYPGWLRE